MSVAENLCHNPIYVKIFTIKLLTELKENPIWITYYFVGGMIEDDNFVKKDLDAGKINADNKDAWAYYLGETYQEQYQNLKKSYNSKTAKWVKTFIYSDDSLSVVRSKLHIALGNKAETSYYLWKEKLNPGSESVVLNHYLYDNNNQIVSQPVNPLAKEVFRFLDTTPDTLKAISIGEYLVNLFYSDTDRADSTIYAIGRESIENILDNETNETIETIKPYQDKYLKYYWPPGLFDLEIKAYDADRLSNQDLQVDLVYNYGNNLAIKNPKPDEIDVNWLVTCQIASILLKTNGYPSSFIPLNDLFYILPLDKSTWIFAKFRPNLAIPYEFKGDRRILAKHPEWVPFKAEDQGDQKNPKDQKGPQTPPAQELVEMSMDHIELKKKFSKDTETPVYVTILLYDNGMIEYKFSGTINNKITFDDLRQDLKEVRTFFKTLEEKAGNYKKMGVPADYKISNFTSKSKAGGFMGSTLVSLNMYYLLPEDWGKWINETDVAKLGSSNCFSAYWQRVANSCIYEKEFKLIYDKVQFKYRRCNRFPATGITLDDQKYQYCKSLTNPKTPKLLDIFPQYKKSHQEERDKILLKHNPNGKASRRDGDKVPGAGEAPRISKRSDEVPGAGHIDATVIKQKWKMPGIDITLSKTDRLHFYAIGITDIPLIYQLATFLSYFAETYNRYSALENREALLNVCPTELPSFFPGNEPEEEYEEETDEDRETDRLSGSDEDRETDRLSGSDEESEADEEEAEESEGVEAKGAEESEEEFTLDILTAKPPITKKEVAKVRRKRTTVMAKASDLPKPLAPPVYVDDDNLKETPLQSLQQVSKGYFADYSFDSNKTKYTRKCIKEKQPHVTRMENVARNLARIQKKIATVNADQNLDQEKKDSQVAELKNLALEFNIDSHHGTYLREYKGENGTLLMADPKMEGPEPHHYYFCPNFWCYKCQLAFTASEAKENNETCPGCGGTLYIRPEKRQDYKFLVKNPNDEWCCAFSHKLEKEPTVKDNVLQEKGRNPGRQRSLSKILDDIFGAKRYFFYNPVGSLEPDLLAALGAVKQPKLTSQGLRNHLLSFFPENPKKNDLTKFTQIHNGLLSAIFETSGLIDPEQGPGKIPDQASDLEGAYRNWRNYLANGGEITEDMIWDWLSGPGVLTSGGTNIVILQSQDPCGLGGEYEIKCPIGYSIDNMFLPEKKERNTIFIVRCVDPREKKKDRKDRKGRKDRKDRQDHKSRMHYYPIVDASGSPLFKNPLRTDLRRIFIDPILRDCRTTSLDFTFHELSQNIEENVGKDLVRGVIVNPYWQTKYLVVKTADGKLAKVPIVAEGWPEKSAGKEPHYYEVFDLKDIPDVSAQETLKVLEELKLDVTRYLINSENKAVGVLLGNLRLMFSEPAGEVSEKSDLQNEEMYREYNQSHADLVDQRLALISEEATPGTKSKAKKGYDPRVLTANMVAFEDESMQRLRYDLSKYFRVNPDQRKSISVITNKVNNRTIKLEQARSDMFPMVRRIIEEISYLEDIDDAFYYKYQLPRLRQVCYVPTRERLMEELLQFKAEQSSSDAEIEASATAEANEASETAEANEASAPAEANEASATVEANEASEASEASLVSAAAKAIGTEMAAEEGLGVADLTIIDDPHCIQTESASGVRLPAKLADGSENNLDRITGLIVEELLRNPFKRSELLNDKVPGYNPRGIVDGPEDIIYDATIVDEDWLQEPDINYIEILHNNFLVNPQEYELSIPFSEQKMPALGPGYKMDRIAHPASRNYQQLAQIIRQKLSDGDENTRNLIGAQDLQERYSELLESINNDPHNNIGTMSFGEYYLNLLKKQHNEYNNLTDVNDLLNFIRRGEHRLNQIDMALLGREFKFLPVIISDDLNFYCVGSSVRREKEEGPFLIYVQKNPKDVSPDYQYRGIINKLQIVAREHDNLYEYVFDDLPRTNNFSNNWRLKCAISDLKTHDTEDELRALLFNYDLDAPILCDLGKEFCASDPNWENYKHLSITGRPDYFLDNFLLALQARALGSSVTRENLMTGYISMLEKQRGKQLSQIDKTDLPNTPLSEKTIKDLAEWYNFGLVLVKSDDVICIAPDNKSEYWIAVVDENVHEEFTFRMLGYAKSGEPIKVIFKEGDDSIEGNSRRPESLILDLCKKPSVPPTKQKAPAIVAKQIEETKPETLKLKAPIMRRQSKYEEMVHLYGQNSDGTPSNKRLIHCDKPESKGGHPIKRLRDIANELKLNVSKKDDICRELFKINQLELNRIAEEAARTATAVEAEKTRRSTERLEETKLRRSEGTATAVEAEKTRSSTERLEETKLRRSEGTAAATEAARTAATVEAKAEALEQKEALDQVPEEVGVEDVDVGEAAEGGENEIAGDDAAFGSENEIAGDDENTAAFGSENEIAGDDEMQLKGSRKQWIVINTKPDGNCLFRAVASGNKFLETSIKWSKNSEEQNKAQATLRRLVSEWLINPDNYENIKYRKVSIFPNEEVLTEERLDIFIIDEMRNIVSGNCYQHANQKDCIADGKCKYNLALKQCVINAQEFEKRSSDVDWKLTKIKEYYNHIKRDRMWGSELEQFALANLLNVRINVYTQDIGYDRPTYYFLPASGAPKGTIDIYHQGGCHYETMYPKPETSAVADLEGTVQEEPEAKAQAQVEVKAKADTQAEAKEPAKASPEAKAPAEDPTEAKAPAEAPTEAKKEEKAATGLDQIEANKARAKQIYGKNIYQCDNGEKGGGWEVSILRKKAEEMGIPIRDPVNNKLRLKSVICRDIAKMILKGTLE